MRTAPKVFISHASEDKQRFVEPFAQRLRASGIDAWLDKWEMNPGDSLVDKIFESGLKDCDAMIVVLSSVSVNKKWVREELNAAVVKRISDNTKLIPVRLDQCEVPECLKSTLWQDVPDTTAYDGEFARILNALYGHYAKPPIGQPPAYISESDERFEGLSKTDSAVFRAACEWAVETGECFIPETWLRERAKELGLTTEQLLESQRLIHDKGYAKVHWVHDRKPAYSMSLCEGGFNQYARTRLDYGDNLDSVALGIVRDGLRSSYQIIEKTGRARRLVDHALFVLDNNGLIKMSKLMSGERVVHSFSPELKRKLES